MTDLRALLAPIRARLAAATPGPWSVEHDNADDWEMGISDGDYPCCIVGPLNVSLSPSDAEKPWWKDSRNKVSEVSEMSNEDAEFIANAPTDLTRLLAAIEAVVDLSERTLNAPIEYSAGYLAKDIQAALAAALGSDTTNQEGTR